MQRRVALDDLLADPASGIVRIAIVGGTRAHHLDERTIDLDPERPLPDDPRQPLRHVEAVERDDAAGSGENHWISRSTAIGNQPLA